MWGAAGRGPREYWNPLFLLRCLSMHPMLGCVGGLSKRHGAAFFLGAQALMLYQTIKAHFFSDQISSATLGMSLSVRLFRRDGASAFVIRYTATCLSFLTARTHSSIRDSLHVSASSLSTARCCICIRNSLHANVFVCSDGMMASEHP